MWSSVLIGSDCQRAQAKAIADSGLARSELFISATVCSKADPTFGDCASCSDADSCYQQTKASAADQFERLGVHTLDMIFLDKPTAAGCDGILGQWRALEELYLADRVRALAVDNFGQADMQCILAKSAAIAPHVTMANFSVGHGKDTIVEDSAKHGAVVLSYSPLQYGRLVKDEQCQRIGAKYGKSAVQVALKWVLQRNATLVTQSTKLSHLRSDVDIFDFALSEDDMAQLNQRVVTALV